MSPSVSLVRKFLAVATSIACAALGGAMTFQSSALAAGGEQHCVAQVGSATSKQGAPVCFPEFSQAISYATGGSVKLPAGTTSVTAAQLHRIFAAPRSVAAATYVIGISWWNTNFQGSTYTHTAPSGCTSSGRDWYFQFPSSWNDKTSSADAFQGCTGYYWQNGNGTSGSGAFVATGWSGGPMNDRATFIDWY